MKRLPCYKAAVVVSLMCLVSFRADAGAFSPCDNPTIFDAKVQVLLFPSTHRTA